MKERGSKSLSGFAISPNPEIYDLESVLGIKFSEPPFRIESTVRNRLIYLGKQRSIRAMVGKDAEGTYRRSYNAFFVRPNDTDRITSWHENMHSYVDFLNPEDSHDFSEFRTMLLSSNNGSKVEPKELEKVASATALDEGIAVWASIKIAQKIGSDKEKEEARDIHEIYTTRGRVITGKTLAEEGIRAVENSLITLNRLFTSEPGFKTPIVFNKTMSRLHHVIYYVGYNFVNQAMQAMVNKGKSVADALDILIKNPPQRTSELRNPRKYVFDRLRK